MDIDNRLGNLLGQQNKIERQMTSISRSLSGLNMANNEAKTVNVMINNTSTLAENVSVKVRRLDEARVSISKFNCEFCFQISHIKIIMKSALSETGIRMSTASS